MDKSKITADWAPYADVLPVESLLEVIELPVKLCLQEPKFIIPSLVLGPQKPRISAVFIVTQDYLCECNLDVPGKYFDFVAVNSIKRFQFDLREHKVEVAEMPAIVYQTARILCDHARPGGIQSIISFVGKSREAWLAGVMKALPISLLTK